MGKRLPIYGLFLSLALILSFVENQIPLPFGMPGMKLGLPNLMVLLLLYEKLPKEALLLNCLRILLSGFLFGNAFSIVYSLGGGILSFVVMWGLYRTRLFSITAISMVGGMAHNIGQLLVAKVALAGAGLFWYAPPLLLSGAVTGLLMGILATELHPRVRRLFSDITITD